MEDWYTLSEEMDDAINNMHDKISDYFLQITDTHVKAFALYMFCVNKP